MKKKFNDILTDRHTINSAGCKQHLSLKKQTFVLAHDVVAINEGARKRGYLVGHHLRASRKVLATKQAINRSVRHQRCRLEKTRLLRYDGRCPVCADLTPDDEAQSLASAADEVGSREAAAVDEKARRWVGALPRAG